jgi:uncharacterized protein YecT (DUF1311 family)
MRDDVMLAMRLFRVVPVLFTLVAPAAAQEVDCSQAMAQQELNICAEQDWQEADKELNATYGEVMAEAKAMDRDLPDYLRGAETALREAQRAWVAFRDANCAVAGFPMRGGSAEPLLVYGCLRQMTLDRTDELRRFNQF